MDISKEEKQRQDFKGILFDLAKDQTMLQDASKRYDMYRRLENLYYDKDTSKRFRHYYSDIFQVLVSIQKDEKGSLGSIDILGQNLGEIRKGYQPINKDEDGNMIDISDSIRKLYDHVNLDIARIAYSDKGDWKVSQEETIQNLNERVDTYSDKMQTFEKNLNDATDKMNAASREHIAILGIFASVVIALTAGISFSTSVLGAINEASVYRVLMLAAVIGLVLVNILYALFLYVDKLVNGPRNRQIKPLLIANVVFIGLIAVILIAWQNGWVEARNARFLK